MIHNDCAKPKHSTSQRYDIYVLVRWIEADNAYDGFLLSGKQAQWAVKESLNNQKAAIRQGTRKVLFPCIYVGPESATAYKWATAWRNWTLRWASAKHFLSHCISRYRAPKQDIRVFTLRISFQGEYWIDLIEIGIARPHSGTVRDVAWRRRQQSMAPRSVAN